MRFYYFIHIILFQMHTMSCSAVRDDYCIELRDIFATMSADYVKCSIQYSTPITFCENCVQQYINVLESYNNMSKPFQNTSCLTQFINVNRLGIVEISYRNSRDLWNRAKCYDCYKMINDIPTLEPSNETVQFKNYYNTFTQCTNKTNITCSECMQSYTDLQKYFFSISNENENLGFCMDIVDLMNHTWTSWGNECCKFRRHNEYVFIGSTIFFILLPILYYILVKFCAHKKTPTIVQQSRFTKILGIINR